MTLRTRVIPYDAVHRAMLELQQHAPRDKFNDLVAMLRSKAFMTDMDTSSTVAEGPHVTTESIYAVPKDDIDRMFATLYDFMGPSSPYAQRLRGIAYANTFHVDRIKTTAPNGESTITWRNNRFEIEQADIPCTVIDGFKVKQPLRTVEDLVQPLTGFDTRLINKLNNAELLRAISEAIEERLKFVPPPKPVPPWKDSTHYAQRAYQLYDDFQNIMANHRGTIEGGRLMGQALKNVLDEESK